MVDRNSNRMRLINWSELTLVVAALWCTGDVRNDIYVTLMQGELKRGAGGKVTDKNVEVTIMVCNQEGKVIPVS